jgi:hypothetical protein
MQTGENEQALRKIIDFTRLLSITILLIHFYLSCYQVFRAMKFSLPMIDHILTPVSKMVIFRSSLLSKVSAIGLLMISLIGSKGKPDEKINAYTVTTYCFAGLLLYFISDPFLKLPYHSKNIALIYMSTTTIGYFFFLTGSGLFFRMISLNLGKDIFNKENESFPQEERHLNNEYSVNLPQSII